MEKTVCKYSVSNVTETTLQLFTSASASDELSACRRCAEQNLPFSVTRSNNNTPPRLIIHLSHRPPALSPTPMYPCSTEFVFARAFRVQGHQNVVQLVGLDDRPQQPLLLLELCGATLDDIVYEGNYSVQDTLRCGKICTAL